MGSRSRQRSHSVSASRSRSRTKSASPEREKALPSPSTNRKTSKQMDTKLKIRSIKRSEKKKTKCKELTKILPTKCNEAKKVTPNVIRSKNQLPKEIANKIGRAQSDQTHVVSKSNVVSPSMHRSKSSLHSTPSIGPSKGKRIDSIAALIAKKKRKRLDAEKCDNLNVGMPAATPTPNKKRKLNSDTPMTQEIKVKKVNVV